MQTQQRRQSKAGLAAAVIGGALASGATLAFLRHRSPKLPANPSGPADLDAYLAAITAAGRPPGLSMVVVKDGALVYNRAFGYADGPRGIPAAPETVYHWWSLTKIPTALAVLQLNEAGKIDLDAPAADYVDFFRPQYPASRSQPVTVRHLLTHTAGLPDAGAAIFGWIHFEGDPPRSQTAFLQEVLPRYNRLKHEPGAQAAYSNIGYMVLGAVIEAASGQPYEAYITEHILTPLGMAHTAFRYSKAMAAHEAAGSQPVRHLLTLLLPFVLGGDTLARLVRERADGKLWFNRVYTHQTPPTGLIGPAEDAARFMIAYLNCGELDGARVLSREAIAMMNYEDRAQVSAGGNRASGQGIGWRAVHQGERLYLLHSGGGPGFGGQMRVYPDEALGMAVLGNDTTYNHDAALDLAAEIPW